MRRAIAFALKTDSAAMTLLLGALIAAAPFAMDVYLASMPSMTRALGATAAEVQLANLRLARRGGSLVSR